MTSPERRLAFLISMTPIAREARLLRQAVALRDDGWDVVTFGYPCEQPMPEGIRFSEIRPQKLPLRNREELLFRLSRNLSRWMPSLAENYYWHILGNEVCFEQIAYVEGLRPDLVIGHEYFSAPLAHRVAEHFGAAFSVDVHEYASEQYAHDPIWRRDWQGYVKAIEQKFLPLASPVSTICVGIADGIEKLYRLPERPLVVRNVTNYFEAPRRVPGETIEVLYHGLVSPLRGLETVIASVPRWRPEFRLRIRGMPDPGYVEGLRELAARHGVTERVVFDGAVDLRDLVPLAARSDIGIFVQENVSLHKKHTLPNKIFEYIMAGLPVIVSDLPEMRRVVDEHDLGFCVPELTPEAVAESVNRFGRDNLLPYHERALAAAKTLCAEVEYVPLVAKYNTAAQASERRRQQSATR